MAWLRERFYQLLYTLAVVVVVGIWLRLFTSSSRTTGKDKVRPQVSHTGAATADEEKQTHPIMIGCQWQPSNDSACVNLLTDRIYGTTAMNATPPTTPLRRWLLLGDSTMYRLYHSSPIRARFETGLDRTSCCKLKRAGRCNTVALFQEKKAETWQHPNDTLGEGPSAFGLENHFCQDCSGCDSSFTVCSDTTTACTTNHMGGYVSVEFARDVEVQTARYRTTQENLAHYMDKVWSRPHPICVVSAGIHDVALPNITLSVFLSNVEWYLTLMQQRCSHLVWLANTAPRTDDFAQSRNQTQEWNLAILDQILRPLFHRESTFVDVFAASLEVTHLDNVHMSNEWYKSLGQTFIKLMDYS